MPIGKVNYDCVACIFIYGVLKAQNQAIGRNLHGVIMKILTRDKKGREFFKSIPEGEGV